MTRDFTSQMMLGFSVTVVTLSLTVGVYYWVTHNSADHDACIRRGGTNVTATGECLRVERLP